MNHSFLVITILSIMTFSLNGMEKSSNKDSTNESSWFDGAEEKIIEIVNDRIEKLNLHYDQLKNYSILDTPSQTKLLDSITFLATIQKKDCEEGIVLISKFAPARSAITYCAHLQTHKTDAEEIINVINTYRCYQQAQALLKLYDKQSEKINEYTKLIKLLDTSNPEKVTKERLRAVAETAQYELKNSLHKNLQLLRSLLFDKNVFPLKNDSDSHADDAVAKEIHSFYHTLNKMVEDKPSKNTPPPSDVLTQSFCIDNETFKKKEKYNQAQAQLDNFKNIGTVAKWRKSTEIATQKAIVNYTQQEYAQACHSAYTFYNNRNNTLQDKDSAQAFEDILSTFNKEYVEKTPKNSASTQKKSGLFGWGTFLGL
jgi:hypothetical protein